MVDDLTANVRNSQYLKTLKASTQSILTTNQNGLVHDSFTYKIGVLYQYGLLIRFTNGPSSTKTIKIVILQQLIDQLIRKSQRLVTLDTHNAIITTHTTRLKYWLTMYNFEEYVHRTTNNAYPGARIIITPQPPQAPQTN